MKRSKQRNKKSPKSHKTGPIKAESSKPVARRNFLTLARNGLLAAIVIGGGGWYFVSDVTANAREHDLSKIGNGIPSIVQVHDTTCPTCRGLMSEVRTAMVEFGDDELQYLVADLNTIDGRALAAQHRVGKVTLLMFDGQGRKLNTLSGPNSNEHLVEAFRLHIKRATSS